VAELFIAPAARADLLAQWDYFADEVGNRELADRYIKSAESTFKNLLHTPGLGRPRKFRSPKAKNMRSWRVDGFPKHLIFYRALPAKRGVEIVRVIHGARGSELQALLKRE
jgi:toxin ParE1/3/4